VHLCFSYDKPVIAYLGESGVIPDLPQQTVIAKTLSEVVAFVQEQRKKFFQAKNSELKYIFCQVFSPRRFQT
jgi:hypothetical protein